MQVGGKHYHVVGIPNSLFHAKVFIWRVRIGGLPLGSTFNKWRPGSNTCFFCSILLKENTHKFIKMSYSMYHLEVFIGSLAGFNLLLFERSQQWVFSQFSKWSKWRDRDIVSIFMISGLQHNYNMCNAFMFDSRHGVKTYMKKLKRYMFLCGIARC